jgi:hypothetical protein
LEGKGREEEIMSNSREGSRSLIYFAFNDDGSKITVSTESTFVVLNSSGFDPLSSSSVFGGMRIINCLHHADLYLLVASGDKPGVSPRRVKIWRESQVLQEIALPSTVERTLWNKINLVLFTSKQIFVYDLRTLSLKTTLSHSPGNNCGAMAISESNLLCYPSPDILGQVIVYDCKENRLLHQFAAHRTEVSLMAMNSSGTVLCTSSKVGTLIRVFKIPSGDLLYTFRISNTNNSITSLQFCEQNPQYLLCGSGKQQWSICYLGEKTQKSIDDIVNEQTVDMSEVGDYCHVEVHPPVDGDNESEFGADARSSITHQSRPSDADQSPGLLSLATAQYLFDFTMKSVQQIRNISQDYLQPESRTNSGTLDQNRGDGSTDTNEAKMRGSGRNSLRLQNDDIRSADWQCSININDEPTAACLVVEDQIPHSDGDDISTLAGSVTAGTSNGNVISNSPDDGWSLKLLVLTKSGVYRRYTVRLPGHTRFGVISTSKQKLTSPTLSGFAAENVLHLEDEKFVFDIL